jgi:hypothetical protein
MKPALWIYFGIGAMLTAMAGLAAYWVQVGFRLDDALGWVGALVGAAGLALAVYGLIAARGADGTGGGGSSERSPNVRMKGKASGKARVYQAGRDLKINGK